MKKPMTRRQFIENSSAAALGSGLLMGAAGEALADPVTKSKVVLVRNPDVLDDDGTPRQDVVLEMLDGAVTALTGEEDPVDAWKTFIDPSDVVGIKSNVWRYIPTTTQVEQALKRRVMDVGVGEERIGIDDRGVLDNPIFQRSTALINARPMRTHHWSGVGTLIKNYIMFVRDPASYHDNSCANLATIWNESICKGKTRLNVLVMLTPQFHSVGPHGFNAKYVWRYNGLMVGFDPVATDAAGLRIIEAKRRAFFAEERPLSPPVTHIEVADRRYQLGNADPAKIELVKIGDTRDILI
jgi:hypothetical protein